MTDTFMAPPVGGVETYVGDDGKTYTSGGWQQGTEPNTPGIWQSYQGADGQTYYRDLGSQMGAAPGGAAAPTAGGTLIDPSTGRPAYTGPNGEGGLAGPNPAYPNAVSWVMPDGRTAWYVPGYNVQQGNVQALASYGHQTKPMTVDSVASQASASAAAILRNYGLEELIPIVDGWIRGGMSWEEAEIQMYDPSTQAGKVFDARFPAIKLRHDAGLAPISPEEYINYERQARQLMQSAGMPQGFYDQHDDFTNLLTKDVSLPELQSRIQDGYVAVSQASPEVKQEMQALYGVGEGGLAAYFIDPTRALPLLQRQVAAAQIGGAGVRTGFGGLDRSEAEGLAARGVTDAQAQQGFSTLVHDQQLTGVLPGEAGSGISRGDQLGAAFGGNAGALDSIERVRRQRLAAFDDGGHVAAGRAGDTGLVAST